MRAQVVHVPLVIGHADDPPHDLGEAFRRLAEGTPVLSPSRDGGINFIGLVRPEPELLRRLEIHRRVRFDGFHIVRSTIDLDDESALNIARTDRAWRGLLARPLAAQPGNCATAQPIFINARSSRAPPR
jgi:hypothetical protein